MRAFSKSEIIEELPSLVKYLGACRNTTIKRFHANGLEKETCKSQPVKEQQFLCFAKKLTVKRMFDEKTESYRQLREYHGTFEYPQMVLPTFLTQNGMVCLCRKRSPQSKEGAWLTSLAKIPPGAARITPLG